ncbi:hypothetical protein QYE76_060588 [Lolium multiflorum]|uniref:Protein kinase domain-containing protein n=1 Tax=Lolium multiflorum TaxID=4521 RepID=A0AAD8W4E4_LOLMU|nr:hypothetical protein QYE76_060588 [Lolium multiflorum]
MEVFYAQKEQKAAMAAKKKASREKRRAESAVRNAAREEKAARRTARAEDKKNGAGPSTIILSSSSYFEWTSTPVSDTTPSSHSSDFDWDSNSDDYKVGETIAFEVKQIVPLPRLCCILLLLSTTSFSHAKEKPCKCSGSGQDQSRNYAMDDAEKDVVFLVGNQSGLIRKPIHKIPNAEAKKTRVLSTIDNLIKLCQRRHDGSGLDESSFNITVVMRNQKTHRRRSSIFSLLILPKEALDFPQVKDSLPLAKQLATTTGKGYQLNLSRPTSRSGSVSDRYAAYAYMKIGKLGNPARTGYDNGKRAMGVDIVIRPPASNYSVWIDYDRMGRVSVYIDVEGKPKPPSAMASAPFNISSAVSWTSPFVHFDLLSTLEMRLRPRGIRFSATVDNLPDYPDKGSFLKKKVTILSSILGSVATAAMMAVAVMGYFNSRYRRWHKELNQLAKSMERLPGMPTKVEFADINKATSNFHDTMKLGGGGFGTVYRCTLPAAASKTEWPMDVAVKRFTREVQNRRYGDFLAEVSIINRLRHKNIVPLVVVSRNIVCGCTQGADTTGIWRSADGHPPSELRDGTKGKGI